MESKRKKNGTVQSELAFIFDHEATVFVAFFCRHC